MSDQFDMFLIFDWLWCKIELVPNVFEDAQPKFKRLILKILNLIHDHDTAVIGSEGSVFSKQNSCFIQNYFWWVNYHDYENLIIDFNSCAIIFLFIMLFTDFWFSSLYKTRIGWCLFILGHIFYALFTALDRSSSLA